MYTLILPAASRLLMINYPLPITDPVYKPASSYSPFQRAWLQVFKDPRDLPFANLLTGIHIWVLPVAILLFTPVLQGWQWWLVAVPYFYVSQFYYKGSFGLMLHCFSHRKVWRPGWQWMQKYVLWILCPLFGHFDESYVSHHIGMHHIAGNLPHDTSSTMPYQRDSIKDFIRYWLTFLALGPYNTWQYLFKRKLSRFYVPLSWSELGFMAVAIGLCFVNLKATLWVLVGPLLFARLVMMLGNWAQHAFVDPDEPQDELASTVICINTKYNHKCWNDGYHAFHHLRQAAHYTEYPLMLEKHREELAAKKTFVFNGIHYLHIFAWLMARRYDKLANHLVNINGAFADKEDAIALMKARVKRFEGFEGSEK